MKGKWVGSGNETGNKGEGKRRWENTKSIKKLPHHYRRNDWITDRHKHLYSLLATKKEFSYKSAAFKQM